mmetsp:Transcript_25984/g.77992  ORF Transcript_25984/g.77992 Transcript_25984/m.77992 type:complete len:160 (-) Transcript_25984:217-696(-)
MNAADWPRQARAFVALNEHWRAAGVGPWRYVALDAAHPLSCFCEGYLAWERHFRPRRGAMSAADDVGADDADDAAAARRPAEDAVEFERRASRNLGGAPASTRVAEASAVTGTTSCRPPPTGRRSCACARATRPARRWRWTRCAPSSTAPSSRAGTSTR